MTTQSMRSPSKPRAAIYARVSSEKQTQEKTIDSQVAALCEEIAGDGLTLDEECRFLDDGVSGSTLYRPALERLRDMAYVGGFTRLYVHSPDRLARKYAYQVLLLDELQKQGIEVVYHDVRYQNEEAVVNELSLQITQYGLLTRLKIDSYCGRSQKANDLRGATG